MTLINQNQQAFLQMVAQGGGGQGGAAAGGSEAEISPGAHVVRLTPEEHAAFMRIKSMGLRVPDQLIIEVCYNVNSFILMLRHTLLVTRMKN